MRKTVFLYGLACYGVFLVTFLLAIRFVTGGLPDGQPTSGDALAIDLFLLALFALQHSGMARPAFKRWIPKPIERSTYVLASSLALLLLMAFWQPLGGTVWHFQGPLARLATGLGVAGWLIVLGSTFLINHFDLFGLRQVWLYLRDRPYRPLKFTLVGPYRYVRHPLYVGWLLAFWGTPAMTVTHLFFALGTTVYILLAIRWEERDLMAVHPEYADYRRRVPALCPHLKGAKSC